MSSQVAPWMGLQWLEGSVGPVPWKHLRPDLCWFRPLPSFLSTTTTCVVDTASWHWWPWQARQIVSFTAETSTCRNGRSLLMSWWYVPTKVHQVKKLVSCKRVQSSRKSDSCPCKNVCEYFCHSVERVTTRDAATCQGLTGNRGN